MSSDIYTSRLFKGTLILTISTLILKVLSAFYRIPYQNIVGDTGFYVYQQIYPIYGVIMVISFYGIPLAVSKLMVDAEWLGVSRRELISASIFWVASSSAVCFGIVFLGADTIAGLMSDQALAPLIRVVSFTFLMMPLPAVIRGYYQGKQQMIPTAYSQLLEQLVRVSIILLLSMWLVNAGADDYLVGTGAMVAAVAGSLASLVLLLVYLRRHKSSLALPLPPRAVLLGVGRSLVLNGFAFCLVSMLLVLLQLMDSFQLVRHLLENGYGSEEAKITKGVYDRGQPLLQLGTVLATSLALSVVPYLVTVIKQNLAVVPQKIRLAMRFCLGVGVGATVGLILILEPVNTMLFENANGSDVLIWLMPTILFASVTIIGASILQTLGEVWKGVLVVLGVVLLKFIGNSLLVTRFGITGAAMASSFATLLGAVTIYFMLRKKMGARLFTVHELSRLIIAAAIMGVILMVYNAILPWDSSDRKLEAVHAVSASILGGVVYLIALFKLGFFQEEELALLPFSSRLQFLLKKD